MSNEAARAALRERSSRPLALVKAELRLGDVDVYVRALPFRQTMRLRREHGDDDEDVGEARIIAHCLFDADGALLLDPLNDEDLALIAAQQDSDFWVAIGVALKQSGDVTGKASTQPTSS